MLDLETKSLRLRINGEWRELDPPPTHRTLLQLLRGLGLVGAKEGCAEGECGACAVAMATPTTGGGAPTAIRAVNSCLIPAIACHGEEVWTVEGLGTPAALHPVQAAMVATSGSQCGYCTPGFVVSMAVAWSNGGPVGAEAIGGNLCRCTGYRPILEAGASLGPAPADEPLAARRFEAAPAPSPVELGPDNSRFTRPPSLAAALEVLASDPQAVVFAGGTDLMVEANLAGRRFGHLIAIDHLPELLDFEVDAGLLRIGAGLRLSEVARLCQDHVPLLSELLPRFASGLVRNRATLGGNLATASPIGDAAPVLLALDARLEIAGLEIAGVKGRRTVPLDQFFHSYRETDLGPGELIVAVLVPLPIAPITWFEKFSKRREDDISTVAFAGTLSLDQDARIERVRLAFGGVAATPLRARSTEAAITGQSREQAAAQLPQLLAAELSPLSDHRGSAEYRLAMATAAAQGLVAPGGGRR